MEMNWILLGIDAALVVSMAVIWFLVNFRRAERARTLEEIAQLRVSMETMQSEMGLLKAEALQVRQTPPQPRPYIPSSGLSTDRRAEALEMLRQGSDVDTVSTTLRLSQAEASLLEKVQGMLSPASYRR